MNVTFTESAANQAKVILAGEGDDKLNVRCFIQGGGCSGFQYGFTLDEQKEDDHVFELKWNGFMYEGKSGIYFKDATIDYVADELKGSAFVISNPNAKSTCGCGSSAAF